MKFAITSMLGALLIVSTSCSSNRLPQEQSRSSNQETWKQLLSLENQDLREIDEQEMQKLGSFLRRVAPMSIRPFPISDARNVSPVHTLCYLWRVENPDEPARYVLIGADGLFMVPGDSSANACVFDLQGNLLSYTEFSLGWRSQFESVSLISNDQLGLSMIRFVMDRSDRETEQFYALIGDNLSLIRLEGKDGLRRNRFVAENWTIGPRISDRTAEEWENALRSNNPGEVLSALTWIGGKHWDLKIPPHVWSDGYTNPTADVRMNAELVTGVRMLPSVQQRLIELRESGSKWIKEAAELALHPHDGDTSF
jgi:hypothetical protein